MRNFPLPTVEDAKTIVDSWIDDSLGILHGGIAACRLVELGWMQYDGSYHSGLWLKCLKPPMLEEKMPEHFAIPKLVTFDL